MNTEINDDLYLLFETDVGVTHESCYLVKCNKNLKEAISFFRPDDWSILRQQGQVGPRYFTPWLPFIFVVMDTYNHVAMAINMYVRT